MIKALSNIKDPRIRIESIFIISTIIVGYFFVYIYQSMIYIEVPLISVETLISLPVVTLIMLLIRYIIFKSDPLQRSQSQNKTIRFYQNQFPSNYLLKRCQTCIEDNNSCKNYIASNSFTHIRYWFQNIFHGEIEKENPDIVKETFEKGYTCKLLYYFRYVLFFILGCIILVISGHYIYLYIINKIEFDLTSWQIIFPFICLIIILLITFLNRVDNKRISGCWHAWQEINGIHISWLKSHEEFLVNLICHSQNGTKRYFPKNQSI